MEAYSFDTFVCRVDWIDLTLLMADNKLLVFDTDGLTDKKLGFENLLFEQNYFERRWWNFLKETACQYLWAHRAVRGKHRAPLKESASNIIPAAKFTKNVARALLFLVNSFY